MKNVLGIWRPYVDSIEDWEQLVQGIEPKTTGCGPVYELPNPIPDRPNESFAIADMRGGQPAEVHYHAGYETEVYIALQGLGLTIVGRNIHRLQKGVCIVTPPNTAHFTVPENDLVLAVINTPPFKPENYKVITATNPAMHEAVHFDQAQYDRLTGKIT